MAPKRKATIGQEDLDLIREMYTMMGEVKGILEAVQEQTAENTRTLRGHNGTEGIVTRFARLENSVSCVDEKIEAFKTSIKDVPAFIAEWKRYPSLTWMVKHKFKEMSIITSGVITLVTFISIPDNYIAERIQLLVELILAKWLGL